MLRTNFDAVAFTHIGGRPVNEDSVCIIRTDECFAAVLADGLGSHGGGDIASASATAAVKNRLPGTGIIHEAVLLDCLETANKAILAVQKPGVAMKSTAVLLTIENACAAFAHVGDSRAYHFRNGRVHCQTVDHSVSQLAVLRGEITLAQIRFHADRNKLLRALGADEQAHGEFTALGPLQAGDAFLLCTDGFWEYVTDTEMEIDLIKSETASEWLSYMLSRIGGRIPNDCDNLSAIAVLYETVGVR